MFQYKLAPGSPNDVSHVTDTVFAARGITDPAAFRNLDAQCLHPAELLDHMNQAVACFCRHAGRGARIHILVDSDVDGYTSAAMLYRYLRQADPAVVLTYSLHSKKQHGLSEDVTIPDGIDLLLIPDAGSSNVEQCKALHDKGVEVIILDHHESDVTNPYAIVVNNQLCEYPNKQLSGAGIVYRFLQTVDEETWMSGADGLADLCALGLIADNMDVREPETRYLIDEGLSHIKSKLFKALLKLQSYSLREGPLTGIGVQFYIVPLINGMIRAGDSDEKDLLFRAFIETDEMFQYKKRGAEEATDEDIYTRAARLCLNAKNRQNNKSLEPLFEQVRKRGADKDKIIFANATGLVPDTMTGIAAMRVADRFHKPCLLLRKKDGGVYHGSGRNIAGSPVPDLKDFLNSLGCFEYVQGHQGAFGVGIAAERIPDTIALMNERLKDVDFEPVITADFIIDAIDLTIGLIKDIDALKRFYGTGFSEPVLVVKQIPVLPDQFEVMGKDGGTWKITTDDGIALMKFRVGEDDLLMNQGLPTTITAAGRANINSFKGILTCQLLVDEYGIEVDG